MARIQRSGKNTDSHEGFAMVDSFSPRLQMDGGVAAAMVLGGLALVVAGTVAIVALRRVPRPAAPGVPGAESASGAAADATGA